jgi:hypothetical protein
MKASMIQPLRCPLCTSPRLTPKARVPGERSDVHLRYATPGGGLLSQGVRLTFRGSACLDCGHVLLFLDDESLARARAMTTFPPWG